ncbi:hypothetical protein [Streptomyces radiopugnans]|uniref:Uncharacterized protein n=1 Tax=Streptomyces radiopugnans TaxID=403935 RepID=A0A1H9JEL3_9ACTN|nr:hypothetical protein [Streptomyces radiopugnans]SEQ85248.1 hypothetical protein SAMN05216481_11765 [Streptomyces radiopugnans]
MTAHPFPEQDHGHTGGQATGRPSPAPGVPAGHAPQAVPHQHTPVGSHPPQPPAPGGGQPLLCLRSALILLLGTLAATGTAVLTYLAQHNTATALLAGGAAFAGAVLFFHTIIAT